MLNSSGRKHCVKTKFSSAQGHPVGGRRHLQLLSPITISNSIIAGNTDNGTAPDIRKSPTDALTVLRSLIGNNTGSGLTEAQAADGNGNFIGSGATPINPLLGALQNNGGPTFTRALLAGSKALNSGSNALIPLDTLDLDGDLNTAEPVPFDQRGVGFARIAGGTVNMGTYEAAAAATVAPDLTAAKDSGTSNSDNLTNQTVLVFTGTGPLGHVARIFDGSTWIGSGTVTVSGYSVTTGSLGAGTHVITVRFIDPAGNLSDPSPALTVAIDTQPPTVTIVVADTALTAGETSLVTFTFSEAVTGFTNSDLIIQNGTLTAVTTSNGGITWTATFTPTAGINDATNVISLNLSLITDLAGNAGSGTTSSNNYAINTL